MGDYHKDIRSEVCTHIAVVTITEQPIISDEECVHYHFPDSLEQVTPAS